MSISAPAPNPSGLSNHPTPNPSPGPAPTPPVQGDPSPNIIQAATGFGPAGAGNDIVNGVKAVVMAPVNAAQDAISAVSTGFASFGNGVLKVGSDLVTVLIVIVLFALGIFLIFHEQTFPLVQGALNTAKTAAKVAPVVAAV